MMHGRPAEYHAICRCVLSSRRLLRRGAAEPLLEMRRAEARVIAGSKALIVQLCAEVEGVDVRGHLPWVSVFAQETPDEFIHSDRVRDRPPRPYRLMAR